MFMGSHAARMMGGMAGHGQRREQAYDCRRPSERESVCVEASE